jgi:uncharacterized paraquat-inducible protein A
VRGLATQAPESWRVCQECKFVFAVDKLASDTHPYPCPLCTQFEKIRRLMREER